MTKRIIITMLAIAMLAIAPGCKTIMPVIPKVVSVLNDATTVLNIIDGAAQEFFRQYPDIPPEKRAKYVELHARALSAVNAANSTLRGVQDIDQGQYDAAFLEFRRVYAELKKFIEAEGIMQAGQLRASDGTPQPLPDPVALTFKVDD